MESMGLRLVAFGIGVPECHFALALTYDEWRG